MTRKITAAAFVSLDGIMQAPGGPSEDFTGDFKEGGWVFKLWDDELGDTLGSLFSGEYGLLLGRRTYEIFAAYWPYVEGEEKPMGEAFDRAAKYVLTRANKPLDWANSHRMSSIEDVAKLKQSDGPRLVIQGSSSLYPGLLSAGLIDELILMIFPVVLGSGKRLFGRETPVCRMDLIDHKVTGKGTVMTKFTPAGALPPYPTEAPAPSTSKREVERQERMRAGTW